MKKIKKNFTLAFKERNGKKVLNKVKFKLDFSLIEILQLNDQENEIIFLYENKEIHLKKGRVEEEAEIKVDGKIKKILKTLPVILEKKRTGYFAKLISIPLGIATDMGINKENKEVEIEIIGNELVIRKGEKMKEDIKSLKIGEKEISTWFFEKKEYEDQVDFIKRNGKVITIKVGKGGVGKSWITTQLAVGLATEYPLRVLVITSDPQNDIMGMTFPSDKEPQYNGGLKAWVTKGEGDIVKLRKNVDFIPLEEAKFGNSFREKFPEFLDKMRIKYDYILIDSMPMMAIDEYFHKESDKVILPMFGDKFTVRGAGKVMMEIGLEKVLAVIFNRFDNTTEQKNNFEEVKSYVEGSTVLMATPIKRMSIIQTMSGKGQTIWDSKKVITNPDGSKSNIYSNKQLDEVRGSFQEVMEKVLIDTYEEPETITIKY